MQHPNKARECKIYACFIKRMLDIFMSLVLLIILSPVILLCLLVLLPGEGSPFFRQERPGKGSRVFWVMKFRTMNNHKGADGKLLPDAERLTRTGKILRKLSLDELPQLFNVLMGHMSLVGPRPLLVRYLPLYSKEQARRHEVRPGITGMAQVKGRNLLDWEERFKLDVYYVDHISFGLDLVIIWLTFIGVVKRDGIYPESGVPMGPFTGNEKAD